MKHDMALTVALADKEAFRLQAAAKPFAAKLRILELMRDRHTAIRGTPTPRKPALGR